MIKIIPFATLEDAKEADSYAFQFLSFMEDAQGGSWSGVFTNGKEFGILYDGCIEDAFDEELLASAIETEEFYPYVEIPDEKPAE